MNVAAIGGRCSTARTGCCLLFSVRDSLAPEPGSVPVQNIAEPDLHMPPDGSCGAAAPRRHAFTHANLAGCISQIGLYARSAGLISPSLVCVACFSSDYRAGGQKPASLGPEELRFGAPRLLPGVYIVLMQAEVMHRRTAPIPRGSSIPAAVPQLYTYQNSVLKPW